MLKYLNQNNGMLSKITAIIPTRYFNYNYYIGIPATYVGITQLQKSQLQAREQRVGETQFSL